MTGIEPELERPEEDELEPRSGTRMLPMREGEDELDRPESYVGLEPELRPEPAELLRPELPEREGLDERVP